VQHLTLGYLTLNAPPLETIAAASAAGFRSVGIRITGRRVFEPYTPVVGNRAMIGEIRKRIDDGGLRLSNITAYHLFPDVTFEHMQAVIDTTAELGSKILLAHSYVPPGPQIVGLFARYSEYAAQAGIRIAVEFMKYSEIRTIEDATAWLEAAAAPNAGYLLDPLHIDRSGGNAASIRRIDPARIVFVQICDAKKRNDNPSREQLLNEARNERLAPGDGDLPLHDFMDALPAGVEIEYEVPRPDRAGLSNAERARIAAERFHAFIAGYAKARGRLDPSAHLATAAQQMQVAK
jgi:sugar phosphate isomerase/epimerase